MSMNIYIWRHSKEYSSWSMFDEPHIYNDNYMAAGVAVIAGSIDEALDLLSRDKKWNIDEMRRIEPEILPADRPAIISRFIKF